MWPHRASEGSAVARPPPLLLGLLLSLSTSGPGAGSDSASPAGHTQQLGAQRWGGDTEVPVHPWVQLSCLGPLGRTLPDAMMTVPCTPGCRVLGASDSGIRHRSVNPAWTEYLSPQSLTDK